MDLFLPLPLGADAVNRRGDENYNLMARLKDGVTMEQADADVSAIAARIRDKDKRDRTFTIDVVPLLDQVVGNVRRAVLVLLGSVALVLLIACANVANLLLTRATARQKEVAIRTALGAGWQRLVRQLLTESVLLGMIGGTVGLLVAKAALYVVRTVNPGNIPRLDVIAIDGPVLVFTFGVSILTGIVFGLAPAYRAARPDLNNALKAGGRNSQGEGGLGSARRRLRSLLVVAEVALSLMLLVGAGLLVRSFVRIQQVTPGFNPENVISMRLGASGRQFPNPEARGEYFQQFADRLAAVPGVQVRGAVTALPFTSSVGWGSISVEGWIPQPGQELQVDQRAVTPDYFRTMEIPVRQGRIFSTFDTLPNAERVVIIDEKFAQRFWPGQSAIGKHLWNDPKQPMTIVGVVGTVKQYGLDVDGRIVVYRPSRGLLGYQVARASGDPAALSAALVRAIHEIDPTIPGLRHPDDDGPDERLAGAAAVLDDHAGCVRGVRAGTGDRRRLRRDVAPGEPGHARHRRAHGARRAAQPHRRHDPEAGGRADRGRRDRRPDWRGGADAGHGDAAVRGRHARPSDVLDRAAGPRLNRAARGLHSRAARHAGRSCRRSQGGVATTPNFQLPTPKGIGRTMAASVGSWRLGSWELTRRSTCPQRLR